MSSGVTALSPPQEPGQIPLLFIVSFKLKDQVLATREQARRYVQVIEELAQRLGDEPFEIDFSEVLSVTTSSMQEIMKFLDKFPERARPVGMDEMVAACLSFVRERQREREGKA